MPNDNNYINIEMFNAGIAGIKTEFQNMNNHIEKSFSEIKSDIRVINTNINNIEKRLDDIYFSLYFVVITIMIAVIGFIPTITNFFKSLRKPTLTVEKVQEMIDATIAKTQGSLSK